MRKKKLLSLALAVVMALGMLTGCGSKDAGSAKLDTSEHVTLKWYLHGSNVTDDSKVMEEVNKYLKDKINVTLEPIWGTWGDFDEGSTLALAGGDDIDIYFTCSWSANEYNKYAKDGYWVRLDDPENNLLANYGSDIWAALPEVLKTGAQTDGASGYGVYALPGFKDFGTQNTWDVNVTLLKELGYTLEDVEKRSYYEFGDLLQAAKDAKGDDFYPLNIEAMVLERMVTNTVIVNGDSGSCNVLSYYIDPTDVSKDLGSKVVGKFATEEFKKFAEQTRKYYEAGYIDPAAGNAQTANDTLMAKQKSAQYLIGTQSYALGYEVQTSAERGIEVAYVPCTPPYVDKTSTQGAMMAISATSKNPERAMAFLNLLNTDAKLMTMLEYGIEGVHYNLNDDGLVVFTDERNNFTPWRNGMGNITLLPPQEGEGKDFFKNTFVPYYSSAKGIPAFGYVFNPSNVETELAALANVAGQYALALCSGTVDPATALPEFLEKLDAAGYQKVIDEANAQLATYFESQK